jgi:hypothetical protein
MSIKAVCHWGEAEDVCIIIEAPDYVHYLDDGKSVQVPMSREQARELARQLLEKAEACEKMEEDIEEYLGADDLEEYFKEE